MIKYIIRFIISTYSINTILFKAMIIMFAQLSYNTLPLKILCTDTFRKIAVLI